MHRDPGDVQGLVLSGGLPGDTETCDWGCRWGDKGIPLSRDRGCLKPLAVYPTASHFPHCLGMEPSSSTPVPGSSLPLFLTECFLTL